MSLRQGGRRALVCESLSKSKIRGHVVEVLLPKCKKNNDKEPLLLKHRQGHIIVKAQTVCLQLGDHNNFHVNVVDLAMPDDISELLTKVSDDDELVIRILPRYGEPEEFILKGDASVICPSINICADFFRIIPPSDEKPDIDSSFGITVDSQIHTSDAQIGDWNKAVINPREGFCDVFDSTRPILRVLWSPPKVVSVSLNTNEFPNFERDHRVVLEICKNRFDGRTFEYCFEDKIKRQQGIIFCKSSCGLSLAGSKKMKGFYDVDVTVTERSQNEKMDVKEGVMFKRDTSFENLRGLVGFWFRFHTANKRYIITFSLWEKEYRSQQSGILLDEVHLDIAVETSKRERPRPSRDRKRLYPNREVREGESVSDEIHSKPTSLSEGSNEAIQGSEQFSPKDNGNQPCLSISDEIIFSGEKLPRCNHVTAVKRKQTSPKRKRHRKPSWPAKEIPEETSLPGEIHSNPTSLPEGGNELEAVEASEQFSPNKNEKQPCLPVSEETKSVSGEELQGNNHMTTAKHKQKRAPPKRKSQRSHLLKRDYCNGEARLLGQASQFMSKEIPLPAEVDGSVYEQSLRIMEVLGDLRDNGKWKEFDCEADQLLRNFFDCNSLLITVILEQGKAACFRNDQTSAEDFIKKASLKIRHESCSLVSLWKGRANTYLAEIYGRDKLAFGKAQRCIMSAKKYLKNTSYLLDRVCLACEEGRLLLQQSHLSSMAEESRRCFESCIELCNLGLEESPNNRLLLRTHDLAVTKKAMLLLHFSKDYGPGGNLVNEKTLLEARQCLESLKLASVTEMTKTAQVQYHFARSDQYFREQRTVDAISHAQTAFDLSRQFGFDTCSAAEVRLNFLLKFSNSN